MTKGLSTSQQTPASQGARVATQAVIQEEEEKQVNHLHREPGCQRTHFATVLSRDVLGLLPVSSSPRLTQVGAALKES